MAGPSIGTWVKVKNKSGRLTARVMANKFGGGSYEQGQVITQSEYNSYKEKRAEAIAGEKSSSSGGKTSGGGTYRVPKESPEGKDGLMKQDHGAFLILTPSEVYSSASESVSRQRVDAMAKIYKSGLETQDRNIYLSAVAIQGKNGSFEIVAGKDAYMASKKSGAEGVRVIVGSESARKFANIEKIRDNNLVAVKAEKPPSNVEIGSKQDQGAYLHNWSQNMYMGKSANVSEKRIAKYEKAIRESSNDPEYPNRNWLPVYVKQGIKGYEVVGNQEVYLGAKRAGVEKIWTVEVSDREETMWRSLNS